LDDVIIYSKTIPEHLDHLETVFKQFRHHNLTLQPPKCHFGKTVLEILGHVVTGQGDSPNPNKIEAIVKMPNPTNISEVKTFMGMLGYYRRFIYNFSNIAKPLTDFNKEYARFIWGEEQQTAFDTLKSKLIQAPILAYFDENKDLELHTDASGKGISAILNQRDPEGNLRVIAYASRTYKGAEARYPISEQECLAVVWGLNKYREFISYRPIHIMVDSHSLCFLKTCKNFRNARMARWAMKLQDVDYVIKHVSGKTHVQADCLSRLPIESNEDFDDEFPTAWYNLQLIVPKDYTIQLSEKQREDHRLSLYFDLLQNKPNHRFHKRFLIENGILRYKLHRSDSSVPVIPKAMVKMF